MTQNPYALKCPYCNSIRFKKNGKYKEKQRYKCKECAKQFKDTTLTSIHWLHKADKVEKYLEAMQKSLSVRKSAKYAGVSKGTAFNWRHKFLSSLTSETYICNHCTSDLSKTIKTFTLPYSAKGRQKAPETNREPSLNLFQLENGQIKLMKIKKNKAIKIISSEIKACKQLHYIAYSPNKLLHAALIKTDGIRILNRNKTVEPLLNEIKNEQLKIMQWLNRFHGVASKYLQHYWNWYTSMKNTDCLKNANIQFNRSCISNRIIMDYKKLKDA